MIEGLPWPVQVGAAGMGWALLGVAVWAIIAGRLIPKSTHNEVIHDRNEWRAESRIKDAQIAEKDKQLGHLSEVGETQKALMLAIREKAGNPGNVAPQEQP